MLNWALPEPLKSPTLALLKNYSEEYLGGSLAVTQMLQNLGSNAELISYAPEKKFEILKNSKKLNFKSLFKTKKFPVIHRIVDKPRSAKLMQIYHEKKIPISLTNQEKIIKELKKIDKFVGGLCHKKTPEKYKNELKFEYRIKAHDVIIYEIRPRWDAPKEITEMTVAKLKFNRKNNI